MKIKIDQIRTYDDAGYRRRAACLCVRSDCESEVLLVSSSRCKSLWVVPGGGLEPGEDPATTAVREVDEEAGAVGRLGRLLDVFENKDRKTRTYVYVLTVDHLKDDYDDAKGIGRGRKWFSLLEASMRLREHKPVQTAYLEKLIQDKEHVQKSCKCPYACLQNSYTDLLQATQLPSVLPDTDKVTRCDGCLQWSNKNLIPTSPPLPPSSQLISNNFNGDSNKSKTTTTVESNNKVVIYSTCDIGDNVTTTATSDETESQVSTPPCMQTASLNGHTSSFDDVEDCMRSKTSPAPPTVVVFEASS